MFLTQELVFPTNIASENTTSVVRIPPSPFMVHSAIGRLLMNMPYSQSVGYMQ
jgi:hypothetical protein